ncbi:hypothetical protein F4823DRAFT_563082 [Ustulina deusta]|nr:hypothetical protein F4823DRAFT_563082 [Ustulina deusta]
MVGTQEAGTQEVTDFFKLLGALASHSSTTLIEKALNESKELKTTLEATVKHKEQDFDTFSRGMTKLQNELDKAVETSKQAVAQTEDAKTKAADLTAKIDGAKKTIAEKDQKLGEDASTITTLQGNVDALQGDVKKLGNAIKEQEEQQVKDNTRIKELQGKLETTNADLQSTRNELKELKDLSCEVVDKSKEFVSMEIDKIYSYAKAVALKYLIADLSDEVLGNTHLFETISKLVRPIPLPPSNSVPAKKARIAAFLARLGFRLADQIFVPFYLLPDENQYLPEGIDTITVMLSNLSHTDPKRERHLRSILLAISPEEQRRIAYERADDIADEVFYLLGELVREDQKEPFEHDIKKLCRLAVDSWETLRPLKEKVEPFTETEEDSEKYWLPAELDGGSPAKKPQANGLGSKPSLHSLKSAKGVVLVWPGFSYGKEVLKQGFMLLESQVEKANEEARPPKRIPRTMQRAATGPLVQPPRRSITRKSKILQSSD